MPKFNRQNFIIFGALIFADVLLLVGVDYLAMLVRFDFNPLMFPQKIKEGMWQFLPWQVAITLVIFWLGRMYHFIWRNVGARDVIKMVWVTAIASVTCYVVERMACFTQSRSVEFMKIVLEMLFIVGIRSAYRIISVVNHRRRRENGRPGENTMLIGAGEAGRMLIREMLISRRASGKLCCVIDDDESKMGKYIDGVPIVGGRDTILYNVQKYDITQIIFAIPTAPASDKKEILDICKDTECRIKTLPGIYQLLENGAGYLSSVQDVQVEDLLGRESIRLDLASLREFLGGKTVLVTGGGGSIGSELCRQIARYKPKKLIILDIYENNAYDIQQEILRVHGADFPLRTVIASVRDKERIYDIFQQEHPDIVFHAAAHKHVPLMESCPAEAVKNNIFGTYHVVRAAEKFGTEKFILISTDKAVNPTNFMGATKRFCEMILQSRVDSPTEYCAVRFGNVLGSNGSVVPLFQKQIANGGPVTITDKRIIRYFMTIPEATQLVLEAGTMAKQSEIFVLDMGDPVKILDLAEKLIKLSGLEPYKDIDIKEIGLRPGEKLYEELLIKSETLTKTENKKIFIEQQGVLDPDEIMDGLVELDEALSKDAPDEELVRIMKRYVPTYRDPKEVNEQAIMEREKATVGSK